MITIGRTIAFMKHKIPKLFPGIAVAGLLLGLLAISIPISKANPGLWESEGWKTDFSKTNINLKEILDGGPPRDGIPPIDQPKFKAIAETSELTKHEPVISLEINGDARAYPLRVMTWHEIVNDVVGGVPVTVTYCPLCNTAIVFERNLDGNLLDFGTTGKLRYSDLVMYDRQTESWWQQFTGEAIIGKLTGKKLKLVPSRLDSFERFSVQYPKGKVLTPRNPRLRAYGENPYESYDRRKLPYGLFRGDMPEGINPMARIVAIETPDGPYAVALSLLRQKKTLTKGDVILRWVAGQNSALDKKVISKGRDVGNVTAQRKTPAGMKDIVYHLTFAFAFHAFHPETAIQAE